MKIQPVIMSGGSGTRLWPMSRASRPKQFLKLVTDKTMFQETALRVSPALDPSSLNPVVIAGGKHGALITEQLNEIDIVPADIILEPCARNTAAVAAVAAAWVARGKEDALVLLMPADHHIADAEKFRMAVASGANAAKEGYIVTFGIKPENPHTGYGYIEAGDKLFDAVYSVGAFKEKPDAATAQKYLDSGGYFWNAGIFLFKASAMLDELAKHAPDIKSNATEALQKSVMSGAALRLDETVFSKCPSNSIDYAVMENTSKAAIVAPVDVGWTDIGSWSEVSSQEGNKNIAAIDCNNNVIRSDGPFIAATGVEGLIIIATGDAVLVARRDDAQQVRAVVEELRSRGREDLL
ncbi:MAG: mannose-1-phosphate guanylyltransferase/mannose-6-phosphate isomerase [Marinicaulis sp.]|nr:mannose-1-phosphate guanylyltransferase/mannose-6-phosphate isomerase [Marinicaulis sp.]